MKFNFSLRGRQFASARHTAPVDARYTYARMGVPDIHEDCYRQVLAASLSNDLDPEFPLSEDGMAIRKEICSGDADPIARLALHLEGMDFHETALWLTAELAAVAGNEENTALLLARIVRQPLDIPLWLQYYARAAGGQKPGRTVRKHLAGVFHRLDEYTFARYDRETRDALREALTFLRPKPTDRLKRTLFSAILRDQLPVRSSWEQEWHALHHQHYDSPEQRQVMLRDKWKEGISSFRIGYTALLDNLRPMLCAGVSGKVLKLAAEYLGNAAAAGRSRTSPLRLLEVYQSLRSMEQGGAGMLSEALEAAALHSRWTASAFGSKGVSVIAMDVSNSMKQPVHPGGTAQRFDIAPLLAGLWKNKGYSLITGIIGNTWKPLDLPVRPVLSAAGQFRAREGEAGYALNAHLILQDLLRKRQAVDRVLIFTDTRLWDNRTFNQPENLGGWWRLYRHEIAPQARLYLFDLAGYGAKPLECCEDDVYLLAGWRPGVFDTLAAIESPLTKSE